MDLYEFKMSFFDNIETEEFLLFIRHFQMTLEATGTLAAGAKIQHICTLVSGEALLKLDTLSSEVKITTSQNLKPIILVLGTYFFC